MTEPAAGPALDVEAQQQLRSIAAWLLSYSDEAEIALKEPTFYELMLWQGYLAACTVLGREPAGYLAWMQGFTDTVRQEYFEALVPGAAECEESE